MRRRETDKEAEREKMMSATKIAKEEKARTGEKAGEDDAMADEKSGLSGVPGKGKAAEEGEVEELWSGDEGALCQEGENHCPV